MISRFRKVFSYLWAFLYASKVLHSERATDIVYDAVSDLGGVFVKFVQFLCLRTEIFSNVDKMRFLSFYDKVPFEPLDINTYLANELSPSSLKRIRSIETNPVAAGSFAQVYRGVLDDGSVVVVKVKRRNIRSKVRFDLVSLKLLSYVFELFIYQSLIEVPKIIREFSRLTYAELDYEAEIQNAALFYKYYENHPIIKIPKTYPELSTENVIVQEYIAGVPLTALIRYKYAGNDYKKWLKENLNTDIFTVLKSLSYELGIQLFNLEKYYADAHPGNIMILPNDRYAFVDFGIVGNSPRNKRTYYELVQAVATSPDDMDLNKLAENLLKFGANDFYKEVQVLDDTFNTSKKKLSDAMVTDLGTNLTEITEKMREGEGSGTYNFSEMFVDAMKKGNSFKVHAPAELFAMMRNSQLYRSYAVFLEPDWVYMRQAFKLILADVDKTKLIDKDEVAPKMVTVEDALEAVFDWISSVAEQNYSLYLKISKLLQTSLNA
jgi:predicted unusual protein kinase regulating ubiquinone biosynthesis (AarF/ABC1/UbiB family)